MKCLAAMLGIPMGPVCHPGQASPPSLARGHPHFVQNRNSSSREPCGKTTQESQQMGAGLGDQKDSL